jgi:hypothetical protein
LHNGDNTNELVGLLLFSDSQISGQKNKKKKTRIEVPVCNGGNERHKSDYEMSTLKHEHEKKRGGRERERTWMSHRAPMPRVAPQSTPAERSVV